MAYRYLDRMPAERINVAERNQASSVLKVTQRITGKIFAAQQLTAPTALFLNAMQTLL